MCLPLPLLVFVCFLGSTKAVMFLFITNLTDSEGPCTVTAHFPITSFSFNEFCFPLMPLAVWCLFIRGLHIPEMWVSITHTHRPRANGHVQQMAACDVSNGKNYSLCCFVNGRLVPVVEEQMKSLILMPKCLFSLRKLLANMPAVQDNDMIFVHVKNCCQCKV